MVILFYCYMVTRLYNNKTNLLNDTDKLNKILGKNIVQYDFLMDKIKSKYDIKDCFDVSQFKKPTKPPFKPKHQPTLKQKSKPAKKKDKKSKPKQQLKRKNNRFQKPTKAKWQIKSNKPEPSFAQSYLKEAKRFYEMIDNLRTNALNDES